MFCSGLRTFQFLQIVHLVEVLARPSDLMQTFRMNVVGHNLWFIHGVRIITIPAKRFLWVSQVDKFQVSALSGWFGTFQGHSKSVFQKVLFFRCVGRTVVDRHLAELGARHVELTQT